MRFNLFFVCFFLLVFHVQGNEIDEQFLRAEFDLQESVWVSWCSGQAKIGYPYAKTQTEIIHALAPYIMVKIFVSSQEELLKAKQMIGIDGIPKDQLLYYIVPNDNIWLRDISSAFLSDKKGKRSIPDFDFNSYGMKPFLDTKMLEMDKLDANFKKLISKLFHLPLVKIDLVSEGGNRDTNGRGTLIVTDAVDQQRNPSITLEERVEKYKQGLNIKKVILLNKGIVQDDQLFSGPVYGSNGLQTAYTTFGNAGHVDTFCRFVDPHTIVLAEVDEAEALIDPIAFENRQRLEENYKILLNSSDQDGQPFKIIRMPAANSFYVEMGKGDPLYDAILALDFISKPDLPVNKISLQKNSEFLVATSYVNFLISNKVVLIAKYWQEGFSETIKIKDERALKTLQEIYPNKIIIQINPYNINLCGGGIHCLTQHESL